MKSFKDYLTEAEQVDETLDPTSMTSKVLRYLGRKVATAFPWLASGTVGIGLAYSGLLAPLMASAGGFATALTSLGAETALAAGVAGTYAAPSLIQVIKDLFAADENSIQAGIKRWVEKHVGDEADIQEFLNLHAQASYLGQPTFRWRAEEWKVKMSPKEAEAHLEKHNKYWIDSEKQKAADAEKAKTEKPDTTPDTKQPAESIAHFRDLVSEMEKPKSKFQVGQMVKFGMWNKPEQHLTGKIVNTTNPYVLQVDVGGKIHEVHLGNKSLSIKILDGMQS